MEEQKKERPNKGSYLTFEERQKIETYLKQGRSANFAATKINRPYSTINNEVRKNGGRDNYNAEKGQQLSEEIHKNRYETASKTCNTRVTRLLKLERELEILKEQVRILNERIN